jgi:hypothetical protein
VGLGATVQGQLSQKNGVKPAIVVILCATNTVRNGPETVRLIVLMELYRWIVTLNVTGDDFAATYVIAHQLQDEPGVVTRSRQRAFMVPAAAL